MSTEVEVLSVWQNKHESAWFARAMVVGLVGEEFLLVAEYWNENVVRLWPREKFLEKFRRG